MKTVLRILTWMVAANLALELAALLGRWNIDLKLATISGNAAKLGPAMTDIDLRAEIARIDRAQAEIHSKLLAEQDEPAAKACNRDPWSLALRLSALFSPRWWRDGRKSFTR